MTAVDHRALQSPVRDQDARRTCTAFATSAAHEWVCGGAVRSVEDVLWSGHTELATPRTDEALHVREALTGVEAHRQASEATWPYGAPTWPAGRPAPASLPAALCAVGQWRELRSHLFADVAAELDAGLAVVLTLAIVETSWAAAAPDGVIDAPPTARVVDYHAVLAVGHLEADDHPHAPWPNLIVKNSWSDTWGDQGYGYVSERYVDAFATAAHVVQGASAP
ncbi:MAG: C1 family peptidase [Actinomycetales bacterium]